MRYPFLRKVARNCANIERYSNLETIERKRAIREFTQSLIGASVHKAKAQNAASSRENFMTNALYSYCTEASARTASTDTER
jgi:hypothetical protein